MSGISFKLTAAAAGAGMANFIDPVFSIIPTYVTNGSYGVDIAPFNITTLAENVYAVTLKKVSTTSSAPTVSLWTGTPDGGSVFSSLTTETSNTYYIPYRYNDAGFADFCFRDNSFYDFDSSVPFPNPSGTISGRKRYTVSDPGGTNEIYRARARSGSHVIHAIKNNISSGEALVEKLTDGVSQFVYDYYVSGSLTIPEKVIPFSDGSFFMVTNQGGVRVDSSGSILYGVSLNSGLDEYGGILNANEDYIYSADDNGRLIYRLEIATGAQSKLDMLSVTSLSSSKANTYTRLRECALPVGIDGAGNLWITGNGANSDTVACFQPDGTFVRKYSIDHLGSSYRIDLRSLSADGDYIIVGGVIATSSTFVRNAFVAKLAIDGTSTGTGYVGTPSSGGANAQQISVLSSSSDAGSYSWSAVSTAARSFSRRTISGYSLQTALNSATLAQDDPKTQAILL